MSSLWNTLYSAFIYVRTHDFTSNWRDRSMMNSLRLTSYWTTSVLRNSSHSQFLHPTAWVASVSLCEWVWGVEPRLRHIFMLAMQFCLLGSFSKHPTSAAHIHTRILAHIQARSQSYYHHFLWWECCQTIFRSSAALENLPVAQKDSKRKMQDYFLKVQKVSDWISFAYLTNE